MGQAAGAREIDRLARAFRSSERSLVAAHALRSRRGLRTDFFLVVKGRLTIQLRERNIVLKPGELFVVPRGVEHCPTADEEALVLLIEPRGTPNTGDAGGELTAEPSSSDSKVTNERLQRPRSSRRRRRPAGR
jgi:mannose-6-phosphate isomerase-like protein (cupin superfamily)